jgi:hypothetical protein
MDRRIAKRRIKRSRLGRAFKRLIYVLVATLGLTVGPIRKGESYRWYPTTSATLRRGTQVTSTLATDVRGRPFA